MNGFDFVAKQPLVPPSPLFAITADQRQAIKQGVKDGVMAALNDASPDDPVSFPGINKWAKIVRYVHGPLVALGCKRLDPKGQPQFITPEGVRIVFCTGEKVSGEDRVEVCRKGEVSLGLVRRNQKLGFQGSLFPVDEVPPDYTVFVASHTYEMRETGERKVKIALACPDVLSDDREALLCRPGYIEDLCDETLVYAELSGQPESVPVEVIVIEKTGG